jgi:orotate phosphoribosyltransferase
MTTGGSALQAIQVLRDAGCSILAVLTVVDREEGGRKTLEDAGIPQILTLTTARELLDLHSRG